MNVTVDRVAEQSAAALSTEIAAEETAPAAKAPAGEAARFEQLLQRMREGSQDAAQEIVETYGPHIRSAVKRRMAGVLRSTFDSEDFVQSAWKSLLRMPPDKVDEIRDPQGLVRLLGAIAARKAINQYHHRTQKACDETRRCRMDDPEVLTALAALAGINTPSQICIAREKQDEYRQRWEDLVSRQPPHHQRIVYLRLGGQPFAAIAEAEEVTERQARRVVDKLFRRLWGSDRAA